MDEQIISRTPQGQKEQLEEKLLSTEKKGAILYRLNLDGFKKKKIFFSIN